LLPKTTQLTSLLTWLVLCNFSVSPTEDTAILAQMRWSRQNHRWCWTPSQNTTSMMH
jgi:hypothetical protein